MLHQFLKDATKHHHDELEQLMFVNEIMDGSLTLDHYRQILITNYIIHKAFEDELFDSLSPEVANQLDINNRHKLAALQQDLDELTISVADDEIPKSLVFDKNDAAILGAMYVMEGATLGGSVIVRKLQINLQLNHLGLNFNYYNAYGDQLIPRWKTFCEVLNEQPESAYQQALASAQQMFNYIADIQQHNNKLTV